MEKTEKLFKIRVKDCPEVKCCPNLRKFTGMVRIATMTATGLFLFTFMTSSGFNGLTQEIHQISPNLVDIIS